METTEPKRRAAWLIGTASKGEFSGCGAGSAYLCATAVEIHDDETTGRIVVRNPGSDSPRDDLEIETYLSTYADGSRPYSSIYIRYKSAFSIDLQRAERMAKELKRIQGAIAREIERNGYPDSPAEALARQIKAVGGEMVMRKSDAGIHGYYDESDFATIDTARLRRLVADSCRQLQAEHDPAHAEIAQAQA